MPLSINLSINEMLSEKKLVNVMGQSSVLTIYNIFIINSFDYIHCEFSNFRL